MDAKANLLKSIEGRLTIYACWVSQGEGKRSDASEDMYCDLLNTAFGYKLQNMNWVQDNFPAIDLGDDYKRLAVQVTSTKTPDKVKNTLKRFFDHELNKKYENAAIISAEESVAIAKEHFKNYVGSEEIASQFEFNVTVEFDNEYSVTATRYVNGLRTYEEVAYVVGSHGNIFSYYVDVDATMDVNKCPNQEQMLVVEAAAKNKLEEIYGDSRIDSYTCGEVEPLFVRLSNGSYAVEYNFTNLKIKTSKNAEPITDPTRLFVILE